MTLDILAASYSPTDSAPPVLWTGNHSWMTRNFPMTTHYTFRLRDFPANKLQQFNTHRAFSRNVASGRAVPTDRILASIVLDERKGRERRWLAHTKQMQSYEPLSDYAAIQADKIWLAACDTAMEAARQLALLGVHKQQINTLLIPFKNVDIIFTSGLAGLQNFVKQRGNKYASDAMQEAATLIDRTVANSTPVPAAVHAPLRFSSDNDVRPSIARLARVSYAREEAGTEESNLALWRTLIEEDPQKDKVPHWSPLEHTLYATKDAYAKYANYQGFQSLRWRMEHGLTEEEIIKES